MIPFSDPRLFRTSSLVAFIFSTLAEVFALILWIKAKGRYLDRGERVGYGPALWVGLAVPPVIFLAWVFFLLLLTPSSPLPTPNLPSKLYPHISFPVFLSCSLAFLFCCSGVSAYLKPRLGRPGVGGDSDVSRPQRCRV